MTPPATLRAIFFEHEHALATQARLLADGHSAEVVRERYAGEDDDEDHPWAVLTDAPSYLVELLVDQYDGWLDDGTGSETPPDLPEPPPDLPASPRR